MAFTASTAFEARVTNGRFNDLENIAGKFGTVSDGVLTPADCSAGWLCTRSVRLPVEGFSTIQNENTWAMIAATNTITAGEPVYACNPYDWELNNGYAIGHKTLGLGAPSGRYCAFTNIVFDGQHIYRFGVGNLASSLSTNKYCTIASGQLSPTASAPTADGAIYFEVVGTGYFTEGTTTSFGYVDVIAKQVRGSEA